MKFKIFTYYAFWVIIACLVAFIIAMFEKPISIFRIVLIVVFLTISIIDLIYNYIDYKSLKKKYKGIKLDGNNDN